ncbi:unnamed protein product, partial [Amoebophrya sp. A25]|eukprot:GSA25T00024926001.1
MQPQQTQFHGGQIKKLATECSLQFTEPAPPEPESRHDEHYDERDDALKAWKQRRQEHQDTRRKFEEEASSRARLIFEAKKRTDFAAEHLKNKLPSVEGAPPRREEPAMEKMLDTSKTTQLVKYINQYFDEWRAAAELKSFLENLKKGLWKIKDSIPDVPFADRAQNPWDSIEQTEKVFAGEATRVVPTAGQKDLFVQTREGDAELGERPTWPIFEGPTLERVEDLLLCSEKVDSEEHEVKSPPAKQRKIGSSAEPPLSSLFEKRGPVESSGAGATSKHLLPKAFSSGEYKELSAEFIRELEESWKLAEKDEAKDAMDVGSMASLLGKASVDGKAAASKYLQEKTTEAKKLFETGWRWMLQKMQLRAPAPATGAGNTVTPYAFFQEHLCDRSPLVHDAILIALALRSWQRSRRLLQLLSEGKGHQLGLELEKSDKVYYSVTEFPEWLAFEIDNNVCIRETQAEVAIELVRGTTSRVLQLDMGEGKTAIIVPIVLAALARACASTMSMNIRSEDEEQDKNPITRLTVLSSLYATNVKDLQQRLGGLLDRRVIPQLCRRDLHLTPQLLNRSLNILEKARRRGDVVVATPECRLSLENKSLEASAEGLSSHYNEKTSRGLRKLVAFFEEHGRELLDESDELLSSKHQLVYSLGTQSRMDGEHWRFRLSSIVLSVVSAKAEELQQKFGSDVVEVCRGAERGGDRDAGPDSVGNGNSTSSSSFTYYTSLRLLEHPRATEVFETIRTLCVDAFLSDEADSDSLVKKDASTANLVSKHLPDDSSRIVFRAAVLDSDFSDFTAESGNFQKALDSEARTAALAFRELLTYSVLFSVLKKRWRVDYGQH